MRRAVVIVTACLLLCLALVAGYVRGRSDAILNDLKVYHGCLLDFDRKGHGPELKESLEGRYYYFCNRLPLRVLNRAVVDYGPPSTNVFRNLPGGKGPTSVAEEYRKFEERIEEMRRSGKTVRSEAR